MRVALLSLLLSTVPSAFGYRAAAALQRTTTKPLVTTSPTFAEATFRKVATVQRTRPPVASVTVEEDYRVSAGFVAVGLVVLFAPWLIGGFSLVLGLFLVFQTLRIRFVFDDDAFEVKTKPLDGLCACSGNGSKRQRCNSIVGPSQKAAGAAHRDTSARSRISHRSR